MREQLAREGLLDGYATVEEALVRWEEVTDRQWARFAAGEIDFLGQRRERVRMFLGEDMTDTEADAWFDRYIGHYEAAWALFPDVLPVLDLLAASHRHGVLSNSSLRVQDRKLRVLGVRDRFEAVLCAAELGFHKPDAQAFHAACDALRPASGARWRTSVTIRRSTDGVPSTPGCCPCGSTAAASPVVEQAAAGPHRIASLAELPALLGADTRFGAPSTFG